MHCFLDNSLPAGLPCMQMEKRREYTTASPKNSLQWRMLGACILCTAAVLGIVIGLSLGVFNRLALRTTVQASSWTLQLAMENMESVVGDIIDLANWSAANNRILAFVTATGDEDVRRQQLEATRLVQDRMNSSKTGNYINKLIISSTNGSFIEQGTSAGMPGDVEASRSMPFFQEKLKAPRVSPDLLYEEKFPFATLGLALPVVKRIYSGIGSQHEGWVYISINNQVIANSLERFDFVTGSQLYIKVGESFWEITRQQTLLPADHPEDLSRLHIQTLGKARFAEYPGDGEKRTVVLHTSSQLEWTLVEVFENREVVAQRSDYIVLILLVSAGILCLSLVIVSMMNRMVNRPIKRIINQLDMIASGDFTPNPLIESDNEIGRIGIDINRMSRQLGKLMEDRVETEKQQKNLELKMLQTQINPHFLYNTLNSIKWMADIQKAKGISAMVSSLAILLKNIAKGTDEIIPLQEELALLDEYINIERHCSGDLYDIHYQFEDEALKQCRIIKFTLQPVVENAIFHGLAPRGTGGSIIVDVRRTPEGSLRISIEDDGVGMSAEQVDMALTSNRANSRSFNKIGLKNVDERIKLTFGLSYGLTVDSKLGYGTLVEIILPLVMDKGDDSNA